MACQADKMACKPICRAWAGDGCQIQAQAKKSHLAWAQAKNVTLSSLATATTFGALDGTFCFNVSVLEAAPALGQAEVREAADDRRRRASQAEPIQ